MRHRNEEGCRSFATPILAVELRTWVSGPREAAKLTADEPLQDSQSRPFGSATLGDAAAAVNLRRVRSRQAVVATSKLEALLDERPLERQQERESREQWLRRIRPASSGQGLPADCQQPIGMWQMTYHSSFSRLAITDMFHASPQSSASLVEHVADGKANCQLSNTS